MLLALVFAAAMHAQRTSAAGVFPGPCAVALTVSGSGSFETFMRETASVEELGEMTVLSSERDPEGGQAGCFRAHVAAAQWALARGCTAAVVLEDDAYFRPALSERWSEISEFVLERGDSFDVLWLGGLPAGPTESVRDPRFPHVRSTTGHLLTHAYVASAAGLRRLAAMTLPSASHADERSVDVFILLHEVLRWDRSFELSPPLAFQRAHAGSASGAGARRKWVQLSGSYVVGMLIATRAHVGGCLAGLWPGGVAGAMGIQLALRGENSIVDETRFTGKLGAALLRACTAAPLRSRV